MSLYVIREKNTNTYLKAAVSLRRDFVADMENALIFQKHTHAKDRVDHIKVAGYNSWYVGSKAYYTEAMTKNMGKQWCQDFVRATGATFCEMDLEIVEVMLVEVLYEQS